MAAAMELAAVFDCVVSSTPAALDAGAPDNHAQMHRAMESLA